MNSSKLLHVGVHGGQNRSSGNKFWCLKFHSRSLRPQKCVKSLNKSLEVLQRKLKVADSQILMRFILIGTGAHEKTRERARIDALALGNLPVLSL